MRFDPDVRILPKKLLRVCFLELRLMKKVSIYDYTIGNHSLYVVERSVYATEAASSWLVRSQVQVRLGKINCRGVHSEVYDPSSHFVIFCIVLHISEQMVLQNKAVAAFQELDDNATGSFMYNQTIYNTARPQKHLQIKLPKIILVY